jgi:hypothetical protein
MSSLGIFTSVNGTVASLAARDPPMRPNHSPSTSQRHDAARCTLAKPGEIDDTKRLEHRYSLATIAQVADLFEGASMNRPEAPFLNMQEAVLEYGDGEYVVLKPGHYVRCAVTGQRIPLDQLRYWSVDLNEAYASPEAVLEKLKGEGQIKR